MIKRKMASAAAAVALVALLQGCGDNNYPDEARLDIPAQALSALQSNTSAQIRYFSQENIASARALITDASKLESFLNDISVLEAPKLSALDDRTINQSAQALVEDRQSAERQWDQQVKERRDTLNSQLAVVRKELSDAQALEQEMLEATSVPQQRVEALEEQIDKAQTRSQTLNDEVIEAWNTNIVEQEIPVRKLSSHTRLYGYTARSGPCKDYDGRVTVDRLDQEGQCYYLSLPNQKLKTLSGTQAYVDNFDEYRTLQEKIGSYRNEEGSLRGQLQSANQDLRDARLVAENKFGTMRTLKNQLHRSQSEIDGIERSIQQADAPYQKQRFIQQAQSGAAKTLIDAQNALLEQRAAELVDQAEHSEASLDQSFDLKGGADVLALVMTAEGGNVGTSMFSAPRYLFKVIDVRRPVSSADQDMLTIDMDDVRPARTKQHFDQGMLSALAQLPENIED